MKKYKKYFFIVLTLLFIINSKGATDSTYMDFPTDSMVWNINQCWINSNDIKECSNFFHYIVGDTVIDTIPYLKVYEGTDLYNSDDLYLIGFIRRIGDKVFYKDFKNDSLDDFLYYDFALNTGDTLWHSTDQYGIIIFTDEINFQNSGTRKVFTIEEKEPISFEAYFTEGIGGVNNTGGLFYMDGISLKNNSNTLKCLFDSKNIIFRNYNYSYNCDELSVSIVNSNKKNINSIYPNPFKTKLFFKEIFKDISITIYSYTGKIIYEIFNFKGNEIDLAHLNKGIYFLKIDNEYNFRKIIKL